MTPERIAALRGYIQQEQKDGLIISAVTSEELLDMLDALEAQAGEMARLTEEVAMLSGTHARYQVWRDLNFSDANWTWADRDCDTYGPLEETAAAALADLRAYRERERTEGGE